MVIKGNIAVVDALKENQTEIIFGICGTSVAGLLSALSNDERIKYIIARHERGVGSMADGYARVSGNVGICQMHSGPGTLNGMLSIVDAYRDSSPVLLLAGQVARKYIGKEIFGEANQISILKSYTKACFRIEQIEKIPQIICEAFRVAKSGRPGPVMVEIPEDIYLEEGVPIPYVPPKPSSEHLPSESIQTATDVLLNAEEPVILAGGGVLWANAWPELKILSESLQIPVATTQNGRGAFPENHPLALGVAGWYGGNGVADDILENADVILVVGCTFSSLTSYLFTTPIKGVVIHVNIDSTAIGKNIHCNYGIVGDAKVVLKEMLSIIEAEGKVKGHELLIEKIAKKKKHWNKEWGKGITSSAIPVQPQRLIHDIQDTIPNSSIIVTGAGLHHLFVTNYMQTIYPRTFLASVNLGAMGFALPAAIGAKAAKPNEVVVCIIGDGDFMMSIPDLDTAVRYNLNFITVILNNNSYGAPKTLQKMTFGTDFGCDFNNPDFAKLAEVFGACGWTIEKPDEIVDAIKSALDCGKPAVINVQIDPLVIPPNNFKASFRLRNSSTIGRSK